MLGVRRHSTILGLIFVMPFVLPAAAAAGPIHDFAAVYAPTGKVTSLGDGPFSVGPVTARAYSTRSGKWASDRLIARKETGDHGLGVCSESQASTNGACNIGKTGGGDNNELSNTDYFEAILMSLDVGHRWTGLWVSSLDGGDADGVEEGRVYFGNTGDVATLLLGPSFGFKWGDFGTSVEGDILTLASAGGFNSLARYLLFVPDGGLTDNNDYLVWGASTSQVTQVPEPGTLALLSTAFIAYHIRRRRRPQLHQ